MKIALIALLCAMLHSAAYAALVEADLCIYGGTSAGVVAAVQAAKMGKKAVIVEPTRHLGGLTAGGLGYTDIGNKAAIGGISREYYRRLGKHYNKPEAWVFEPGVAEREFEAMVKESGIKVFREERLAGVKKVAGRITEITTRRLPLTPALSPQRGEGEKGGQESVNVFRAPMFIDATYEGDLMARAGVSYHVGREANSVYGETLNGIRGQTPKHQFLVAVDPYLKAGDPASGLLPFIQPVPLGEAGGGDACVQTYNFRLCLTKNPTNRIPIAPPALYDASKYELLGRYFDVLNAATQKVTIHNFLKIDMVTPEKTDINNNGAFSTDYIGMNYAYPDADYATREKIWQEHLDYIKGLLTYLANSPRVPVSIRTEMAQWGLCRDEFQDTGGWPHQMYVREARRMISDCVMSEKHCRAQETVSDAVGLAAYNMDSHNCRRLVRNGRVENEGDVQIPPMSPYSIAYRSIVPKADQCLNLLVPVCLSSSHIAYGSIRMEPVFMILGQSAATAACLAIDANTPVQKVDYAKLKARLLSDGQILEWVRKP